MKLTTIALLLTACVAPGCLDLPGDQGEPCNQHGLCAPGLACNQDSLCVKTSTTCAANSAGLCHDTNFVCGWFVGPNDVRPAAEMCQVPAGTYPLGDPTSDVDFSADFFVDRFEVTNDRYKAFIASLSGSERTAHLPQCSPGDRSWNQRSPYYPDDLADHPVACINRIQASAFCHWAAKKLPSGQEWEAAARSDDGRRYPWGTDEYANMANCLEQLGDPDYCNDRYPPDTCPDEEISYHEQCDTTAPIFDLAGDPTMPDGASEFGHLHMSGNVWEWVSDDAAPNGIIRGGSFDDLPESLVTWSAREVPFDSWNKITTGFRCAY